MSISVVFICCFWATSYALPTRDNLLTIKDPTLFESETHSHIQLEHIGYAHALHTQTVRSCTEQVVSRSQTPFAAASPAKWGLVYCL